MTIESSFFDELEKISKVIQKEFPFMAGLKPPSKPPKEMKSPPMGDPFKKPREVHIGTLYKRNPKGWGDLAKKILDKIGREPK